MFRTESPRYPSALPFRFAGKKTLSSSKTLALRSRSFEEDLLRRLKTLRSASDPTSTFSWLSKAVDLLSSTHADAETLVSDLNISASEKSLASYLDDSTRILDICNSISSEIERLRQGRLLISFVLHLLDPSSGSPPAPEKLRRAREALADWEKSSPGNNKRLTLEKSTDLIKDLAGKFSSSPRGKISSVEKLLERAIYAVGVVTVFVAGVVVAALSGSPDLVAIPVSGEFLWADAFVDLQSEVLESIKKRFPGEKVRFPDEREAVEARVRALVDVIADVAGAKRETERWTNAVKELERVAKEFSHSLEGLLNGVNGFFRAVLCTRNTLLRSFRDSP